MDKPELFLIGGPTASGKTARALEIAQQTNGTIVNADAMQVYRGLPLLTAQPSEKEKAEAPHKLYEILDPDARSSAGRWKLLAEEAIREAAQEGRTPLLVGGTGLYFKALLGGLADIPPISNEARAEAQKLYDELGSEAFREKLRARDPESATKIKPNDRQRLIRAYEVALETGQPLGHWHKAEQAQSTLAAHFTIRKILLMPDRAALYAACDARFLKMIEKGALKEVEKLLARNLDPALPAMKILGVPELAAHLRGETSLDEAIAKAKQATRHYAKRQMTWFRNQWGANEDFPAEKGAGR